LQHYLPTTEVRNGLGISKMVDTIAQAFRACGRRADARLTLPSQDIRSPTM
jgi:hypothetical protein